MNDVFIDSQEDERGNDWQMVYINGALDVVYANCKHCDSFFKERSPARMHEILKSHKYCGPYKKHKETAVKVVMTLSRFF